MTQYVAVKFRPKDSRAWTYRNDGPPVAVGTKVKVPDKEGDGWRGLDVVSVTHEEPPFPTKAILGVVDGFDIDAAILAAPLPEPYKPDLFDDYVEATRAGLAGPDMFSHAPGWEE
jgi:hypothetical protein